MDRPRIGRQQGHARDAETGEGRQRRRDRRGAGNVGAIAPQPREHLRLADGDGGGGAAIGEDVERAARNEQRRRRGQLVRGRAQAGEIVAVRQAHARDVDGGSLRRQKLPQFRLDGMIRRHGDQADLASRSRCNALICVRHIPLRQVGIDTLPSNDIQFGIPNRILRGEIEIHAAALLRRLVPPLDPTRAFAARAAGIPGSLPIDRSIGLLRSGARTSSPSPSARRRRQPFPRPSCAPSLATCWPTTARLNYGPTEGEAELRATLLEQRALLDGCGSAAELLVTAGGTQGIDLACKLFVDRGDLVIAESPTYANGVAIVTSYEGEVRRCPLDGDGMRIEQIPDILRHAGRRPKLFYVIPNFQNPGGATLSLARRGAAAGARRAL